MRERWTPVDKYTPKERELPADLYDVMLKLNVTAVKQNPELSFKDFDIPDNTMIADQAYVQELKAKRREYGEKSEYAAFMEALLPETQGADWFGGNVYLNRYRGEPDIYNDQRAADYILEMESNDPNNIPLLRIDVTKRGSIKKTYKDKVGAIERSISYGKFPDVYFASQAHEGVRKKVEDVPGIVWHLNADQIIDVGRSVGAVLNREKGSNKVLAEHPDQMLLIRQARAQLENQALYALAIFFREIGVQKSTRSFAIDRRMEILSLFDRTCGAAENDQLSISKLVQDVLHAKLNGLPRAVETANMLQKIQPWLEHFENLEQEKTDTLPEEIQTKVRYEESANRVHAKLASRSATPSQILPDRLAA